MLYELTLLFRPDVVMHELGAVIQEIKAILQREGGEVHASEYWGFRGLAYKIAKRSKAHYVMLGLELPEKGLEPLHHYLKFNRLLLRFLILKTQTKLNAPTHLYISSLEDALAGRAQAFHLSQDYDAPSHDSSTQDAGEASIPHLSSGDLS